MESRPSIWDHCLQYAALSDVGLRRANNQDAKIVVISESQEMFQRRGHLFMVADGMGAHAAGELASKLATDTVAMSYSKLLDRSPPEAIHASLVEANAYIHSRGQASPDFKGMGTTSTAMLLLPQGAVFGHVGDSRAYRLRGDRFEQLTFDHSLVWEMRAAGQVFDDHVPEHIPKNIITRSLGPSAEVQVDLEGPFPIELGDTFVLCSDGLSGPVEDEEIGAIVSALPPNEAAESLIALANLRGGPDNITVIVVKVNGPLVAQEDASRSKSNGIQSPSGHSVHPLIWTALGVAILGTLGAAAIRQWGLAVGCFAAAAIAGLVALIQHFGGESGTQFDGRPLGRGPYTACNGAANAKFVDRLAKIVAQLNDAATSENWNIDWHHFNSLQARAESARNVAKHDEAVREYFHAIRFVMAQLKQQRRTSKDSGALGR